MPFNKVLVFLRKIICNRTPNRPKTSLILENHIRQSNYPYWTSYSVKYSDICNDQFGKSHFNWQIDGHNYHILRVGCYPFIKYHCTKRKFENLEKEDKLYTFLKLINLGIPTFLYGLALRSLVRFEESIPTPQGSVTIYFLNAEDRSSPF